MTDESSTYQQEILRLKEELRLQKQQIESLQGYADFSTKKLKALLSTIDVKFDNGPYEPVLLRHIASVFIDPIGDTNFFYVRSVNDKVGKVDINSLLSLKNRFPNLFFKITRTNLVNIMAVTKVVENKGAVTINLIAGAPIDANMDMCYPLLCELAQWEDVLTLWSCEVPETSLVDVAEEIDSN